MKEERLSGALQENILTLLVFSDDACKLIRSAITAKLFESAVFREVASHAIDFIDQFGNAPGDHIADSLEDILTGEDQRKATSYKRLLENLYAAKDGINADYVMSQLHKFVRQQNLKTGVIKAVEAIEDGRIDDAEVELQRSLNTQSVAFELGTSLADTNHSLAFLDTTDSALMTGIDELDKRGIGLQRKEQLVIMAPAGMGKTWGLIQLGKWALLQRQTVLHVTLEMSEPRVAQRYLQAFFSISKRQSVVMLPVMSKDKTGSMTDVFYVDIKMLSLSDSNIRQRLASKVAREFRRRPPLIIKQFPTGMLTVPMLEAYLDGLERFHKITPDVVIIDYPDLMALDKTNLRTSIGSTVIELRGSAVRRNYAQAIASQSNREGAKARMVESTHAAEDYSKIATADVVLTYSQTAQEKKMGLARVFVAKSRNEEGGFITLVTQSYATGQFALDSAHMGSSDYWSFVGAGGKRSEEADD